MERPAWMYKHQEKHGYTNKCAGCKWFEYDPDYKDNLKYVKTDGWCTNVGSAKYFTVGVEELKRNGRERRPWGGQCFYFEPAEEKPNNEQFVFDLNGNIKEEVV